jgi:ATP-dependent helicase/nuclease subunit B
VGRVKNIFTIEPHLPFLDTLAGELWRQTNGDGFLLSKHLVLLPTRRACRHLGASFAKIAAGKPLLLPRMQPLGDIDEEEIAFADENGFDLEPAIAPLKRLMLLTQQVQTRDPDMSWDQAAQGAEALARFLDQIQIEQCDINKLPTLVDTDELAEHWQQTVAFLDIVTKNWPLILAEEGCLDPATRRNAVLKIQADLWLRNPPSFPIIAAGSTGSVPATGTLLNVIASLEKGAVILPGLDRTLDNEAWDEIDETHPQNSMKNLLKRMNVKREDVKDFGPAPSFSPRTKLISEAMRPAGLTDAWRALAGKLDRKAISGLTSLTLDHPQEEAQVIALRLRSLLETPDKVAAFVTADRSLALRVAALLRRWNIDVDDSGGTPLAFLPLGAFLDLILTAASPYAGYTDLLALLKHPLAACGLNPAACRKEAREAEIRVRNLEEEDFQEIKKILRPLTDLWSRPYTLSDHIKTHIEVAEKLAASDTQSGAMRLWQGEHGEEIAAWMNEWRFDTDGFPPFSGRDYAALFGSLSSTKTIRSTRQTHPRLSILGPLEARLISADLIVLGGMNEGMWPPDAGFDPWMSRPMRKKFDLPSPEFRIGLSAHDFGRLACAEEVFITRSLRSNGTPTVPSRFLLQIEAVLRAAGLSDEGTDTLLPQEPWRQWAHALDEPEIIKACERPQPIPPLEARPTTLSVTEITTWLRNPYAIYAKHILKLKKLEELDAELDASDRGIMIHNALEKFTRAYPDTLPADAEVKLLEIGRTLFANDHGNPRVKAFWWARFIDIADWFCNEERMRRLATKHFIKSEPKGKITVEGLTLTGRADRIDRAADGSLSIIDYKTGATPSKAEVLSGLEPQLQLLALIMASGGFTDIQAAVVHSLEYWILKGGSSGCDIRSFSKEIPELTQEAEAGLKKLIDAFKDPETPYEAVPKPRLQPRHNDYVHLSRLAEWGRTVENQ